MAREMPDNPGVYLMKNSEGTVIYVGKAKNLKRRVTSYFLPGRKMLPFVFTLMTGLTCFCI